MNMDYYINVAELMTDIDIDHAESIDELPIVEVDGVDGDYL